MQAKKALESHGGGFAPQASIGRLASSVSASPFLGTTAALPRSPKGAHTHTGGKTMQKYTVAVKHPYIPRYTYEVDARSHADAARIAAEQHVALFGVAPVILSTTPKA